MATSPNRSLKNTHEGTPYNAKNQEAMLIQDGYCSPERPSYKGSSKQTPKSILKEYMYSGSKSKKGIIINETLNETRKLSLKSEASEDSAAKHSRVSDFEKAQAQKRQREREQEIYCEMIRRSNLNTEEAQAAQNADLGKDATYEENRQLLRNFEQKRRSLDNGDSKRSLQSLSSIGYVEEKIQQLEKCLDIYSNRLRDSILRQRDQLLASHYRKTGDIASHNHPGTIRSWEENEIPIKNQENELQEDSQVHKGKNKQAKPQNSSARSKSSQHWEELDHDLKQLRQESNYLKSKLQAPENIFESSSKQDKQYSSNNTHDKEIELLKTVEQIRAKLYNSIAQRSIQERNNQTKTNSSFKKTKIRGLCSDKDTKTKNPHIPPKYQKVREAYGEKTLERENACILNQGLSTTYSGFHWNADQSLKITRNV